MWNIDVIAKSICMARIVVNAHASFGMGSY